ncbi:MAG: hypothetical protein V3V09_10415 [Arenicellales bacterium]
MKTTRSDYDLAPLPAARVFSNFLRWKAMPFGDIERGPGVVWLLEIWFRHCFGKQLTTLKFKHKKTFDRLMFVRGKFMRLFKR